MATPTIDSFLTKFKQLWSSGSTANLTVETNAGKAWVCLRVELGQPQAEAVHRQPQQRSRNGPSRQRRRARRAAERAATAHAHDEPVTEDVTEDTSNASVREATVTTNSSEQVYRVDTDDDDFGEAEEASNSYCENDVDECGDILLPFNGKLLPISSPTTFKPPSPKSSTFPTFSIPSNPPKCCGDCGKPFSVQAKPTQCQTCAETFHKTRCLKSHLCVALFTTNSKSHRQSKTPTQHQYQKKESDLFNKIFT